MSLADLFDPPLEFVCLEEGIVLERSGDKLVGVCPFHADSEPSFALWNYGGRDFVGCWACGFGPTDGLGLIRMAHDCPFETALIISRRYARAALEAKWVSTALPQSEKQVMLKDFTAEAHRALSTFPEAARGFLMGRGLDMHTEWLLQEFRFGGDGKWIVVPHYSKSGKFVTAIKYREGTGLLKTMDGGTLSFLYGCWRDTGQPYVVLAEGESDTWRLAAFYSNDPRVLVLGLPSGAKAPKLHWLAELEGRRLLVLFDGDDAGRRAAAQWQEARPDARVVDPGDGLDASKLSDKQLRELTA